MNLSQLELMLLLPSVSLNSRKTTNQKHGEDDRDDTSRPAEPYGTAVRASTRRFDNSSLMGEAIELPQVCPPSRYFLFSLCTDGCRLGRVGGGLDGGHALCG